MLLDKKKFDLRLYVLITSLDPFIVYLNDEGLARFCTEDYQKPTNENLRNSYMHLTNYSLNKLNKKFIFPDPIKMNILEPNEASKRTLTSTWKSIETLGFKTEDIKAEIEDLIVKYLISMYPYLLHEYKLAFLDKNQPCFHILGFDILLDAKGKPWFLEANANPSLSVDHEVYSSDYKETLLEFSALDHLVKSQVMENTMKLVTKSSEK